MVNPLRWIRQYIRSNQLADPEYAATTKNKLSLLYAFAAWNLFGLIIAMVYKEKIPKAHDSIDYAKVLGIKDAKVVKLVGLNKVDEYDLNLTDKDLQKFTDVIGKPEEIEEYDKQNEERIKAASSV